LDEKKNEKKRDLGEGREVVLFLKKAGKNCKGLTKGEGRKGED